MPDREKVINKLQDISEILDNNGYGCWSKHIRDALALLKEQEAVVRCKDCKYRFVDGDNVRFNMCLLNHNKVQPDDWFCADGERKEGR